MAKSRLLAILLGSSLMIGELIRSWGQGRNLVFVIDDFLVGVPLVVVGILMSKPTFVRLCALAAAFAAAAGMLYPSFFGKIVEPSEPLSSNIAGTVLTTLIGVALATALIGLAMTLRSAASVPKVTD